MKYVAGYILLKLGGKGEVSADELVRYLESVDCKVDAAQAKSVCDALNGKALHELCAQGLGKLGSLTASAAPAGAAQAAAKPAPAAKEGRKEEKKKVEEPEPVEEDADIGGLFD